MLNQKIKQYRSEQSELGGMGSEIEAMHANMIGAYTKAINDKSKKMNTNCLTVEEAVNQVVRQFAKTRDILK